MKALKELATTPEAKAALEEMASYQRNRRTVDVRRLKERVRVSLKRTPDDKAFKSLFQKLDEAGLAEFIQTPGEPPRLKSIDKHDGLKSMAQKALGSIGAEYKPGPTVAPFINELSIELRMHGVDMHLTGMADKVADLIKKLA